MNQKELAAWCSKHGLSYAEFRKAWPIIRAGIAVGLAKDGRVRLVGLGLLSTSRQPCYGRNHEVSNAAGRLVVCPTGKVYRRVNFRPGDFLKELVNADDPDELLAEFGVALEEDAEA